MRTRQLTRALYISALGLAVGLTGAHAVADSASKRANDNGAHMEGERTPQQQRDEQMRRDSESSTSNPGAASDARPGEGPTDAGGTDATRHVPGAPEQGTNPATEPGAGSGR